MIVCFTKQNDNVCYGTLLLLNKIHRKNISFCSCERDILVDMYHNFTFSFLSSIFMIVATTTTEGMG